MQDNVARKAIEVLAARGWHQGEYEDEAGRVCFYGALNLAMGFDSCHEVNDDVTKVGLTAEVIVREQFADRLKLASGQVGNTGGQVVEFNDHPDTTLADVLLVLEKTAIKLDEQAS